MGGSPKAPTTASGRGNQPALGAPKSNRGCPGPSDIMRDGHNRQNIGETSTSRC